MARHICYHHSGSLSLAIFSIWRTRILAKIVHAIIELLSKYDLRCLDRTRCMKLVRKSFLKKDSPKSTILIGQERTERSVGYEAGLARYLGIPGSSGFPSFLLINPVSGFPSFWKNLSSTRECKERIVKAKLRVCRSNIHKSAKNFVDC
ncbi:uncharacterized protein PV09_09752 [Verruconis gallopava]|uniref:Uncharacterized protein n=1 Tax=Verruconis gallopava TaxID=253628 RepID=A0A0D1YCK9_9PEZI|nr:uncharacterized protein PV09_09752 [Verruconis gallopava]KIV98416.1 hypothetical protein PV09_09752 [Verruconis gallopava]